MLLSLRDGESFLTHLTKASESQIGEHPNFGAPPLSVPDQGMLPQEISTRWQGPPVGGRTPLRKEMRGNSVTTTQEKRQGTK